MEIPDKNIFMMCPSLNRGALRALPEGLHARLLRRDELALWKAMPFDDPREAEAYAGFMTDFFDAVYAPHGDLFFERCLVVCDGDDSPVGTLFAWQAYGCVTTLHWYKVIKAREGRGIGRALLSLVMEGIEPERYPVYLHTQPSSYRAIKLYSDFGFSLLTDPVIGGRTNDIEECMPILKALMPAADFARLRTAAAPNVFLSAVMREGCPEF